MTETGEKPERPGDDSLSSVVRSIERPIIRKVDRERHLRRMIKGATENRSAIDLGDEVDRGITPPDPSLSRDRIHPIDTSELAEEGVDRVSKPESLLRTVHQITPETTIEGANELADKEAGVDKREPPKK